VKAIVGEDPFNRSEEDTVAQYNSSLYQPQIIFLGLDERKEGFDYKGRYKGQPWFAVDVTPKESVKEAAEKLIEKTKAEGLDFSKGRMNMSLPAEQGMLEHSMLNARILTIVKLPSTLKRATSSTGMHGTPSALPVVTRLFQSTLVSNVHVHQRILQLKSQTLVNDHLALHEPASQTYASLVRIPQSSWPLCPPMERRSSLDAKSDGRRTGTAH
jgi:hypothetical protein